MLARVDIVETQAKCDPNAKDKDGHSPLYYANGKQPLVHTLIRHGADYKNVYKRYGKVLGKGASKQPLKRSMKIFIAGDHSGGKTTLVEALKREKKFLVHPSSGGFEVTNVPCNTAGIIPHEFESKTYGKVTIYDLAGHREYCNSHSAVLQTSVDSSLPVAILVFDVSV